MRNRLLLCAVLALTGLLTACDSNTTTSGGTSTGGVKTVSAAPKLNAGEEIAVLDTNLGFIRLQLYPDVAPKHVASFRKYINDGFYNGLAFHRVAPGLVIQAGNPATKSEDKATWPTGEMANLPNIPAEFSTLPFERGVLGAARKGNDINSASSQFFVCLVRYQSWDSQYTVFGKVIDGMTTVDMIASVPAENEVPTNRIVIRKAFLEKYAPKP
ncbi:MAG: peptidylprolyl isomerase [Blastocatellia bacterium]